MRRRAPLVALSLLWSARVAAEEERVVLLLPACELPGVPASELRRAVALDLQAEGLGLAPAGELSPGRDVEVVVEAACPTPDELTLRAERGEQRPSRNFLLSELPPEQRARALSLALTELVSLVRNPPPAAAPEAPPPEPEAVPPPRLLPAPSPPPAAVVSPKSELPRAPRRFRVGVALEARFFDGTTLWGGELWLAHSRFRYGAGLLTAQSDTFSGSVWTRLVQASAAYAFPLLGNPGGSALESGPRLGVGHTFMSVQPSPFAVAHDARDWYFDAAWGARYSAAVSKSFELGLGVELGYGRGPIGYADDLVVARTSGAFASLRLDGSLSL